MVDANPFLPKVKPFISFEVFPLPSNIHDPKSFWWRFSSHPCSDNIPIESSIAKYLTVCFISLIFLSNEKYNYLLCCNVKKTHRPKKMIDKNSSYNKLFFFPENKAFCVFHHHLLIKKSSIFGYIPLCHISIFWHCKYTTF